MKTIASVALLCSSLGRAENSVERHEQLWESFKVEHNKVYASQEEEALRFGVFVGTLKLIDARNAKETGTAIHGVSHTRRTSLHA
jgi:hypothetical protein